MEDNNNKNDKDGNVISALGLDRDLLFYRGHQEHWPHDNDDIEDNEVEDNNRDDNNNKNDKDGNSISALGLDRDLVF